MDLDLYSIPSKSVVNHQAHGLFEENIAKSYDPRLKRTITNAYIFELINIDKGHTVRASGHVKVPMRI